MDFLFLLILFRLIHGAIIFYIFFWDALHSPVYFYHVVSLLVLDYDIRDLKKVFPHFCKCLLLNAVTLLLDRPGKGIVLFEVASLIFYYFGLQGHPCTKVKHVCFRKPWYLVVNYNEILFHHGLTLL